MQIDVLGSSSMGNCYLLRNDEECLIIEAGICFSEVGRRLNFDISTIVGCIVSHEHKDHVGHVNEFLNAGIDVYANSSTINSIDNRCKHRLHTLSEREVIALGGFSITPFCLPHNGTPNFGYLISHKEIGKLLFLTDFEYCKYRFRQINHILVEANYSKDDICMSDDRQPNIEHVLRGHADIDTTCRFIEANNTGELRNVLLLHLSNKNSSSEYFKAKAKKSAKCHTEIARKGISIALT